MIELTLRSESQKDIRLFKKLAKRLNIAYQEKEITQENEPSLIQLFGSWQSEQSGDELANEIYQAREDKPRDITL